ncbi:MAG TPA: PAS domain S-box protein [Desulfuromonadales bacterium]|jgi:PAS domain S-box-containing protein
MPGHGFESARTILVVDDSASALALSRQTLENLGYEVACMTNGAAAIDWLVAHPVALVLLDYRLPDMTGRDVVRTLAEKGLRIPFITITAHGDEKLAVEMMKLGALDYLAKDHVFAEMLPSVVRQVLGRLENERRLAVAERAATASEGRFRSIFENAAAGMAIVSPEGKCLQVNPELCRFLGYDPDELLTLDVQTITHPKDREASQRFYLELRHGKRTAFKHEKSYVRKDGSIVWGYASATAVHDENGNLSYCVALVQDITDRKRYEELVASIERGVSINTGDDFFRTLTNGLAEALKADEVFVSELVAQQPERLRSIAAIVDGRERESFEYHLPGTPCENVLGRKICVYPAGVAEQFPEDRALAERDIEGYAGAPLFGSTGEPLGLLVALFRQRIQDPGMVESLLRVFSIRAAAELERRQGELALRQSEQQYKRLSQEFEALLDGIPDVLVLLAPDMRVIWANAASQRQLVGKNTGSTRQFCSDFCASGTLVCGRCPVARSFGSGSMEDGVIRHPAGSIWGIKAFPLKNAEGEVTRVIMLASDITEKKRLREAAARAGRLAAVGELAAGVAHEINNPTGLILMNMPMIREAFANISPILEEHYLAHGDFSFGGIRYSKMKSQIPLLLDEILDGAQRIKNIVDDMKDFARGGDEMDNRLFDLNTVANKAIRLVNNQIKMSTNRFSCDLTGDPLPVQGNPQRIEQVLVNLIINACQALPEKARGLSISTFFDTGLQLCKVIVVDEGIGIPEQAMPHLTDPFFTTRREQGGTGLGLSVSARIVKEHGGSLQFESSPGQGTTVILALPAASEEKA